MRETGAMHRYVARLWNSDRTVFVRMSGNSSFGKLRLHQLCISQVAMVTVAKVEARAGRICTILLLHAHLDVLSVVVSR